MRLSRGVLVGRDPTDVFALVSDPSRYSEFLVGISRWEPRSSKKRGVGARYRVLMRVGSIEAGGTVRITEWTPNEQIAWESERGVEQSGRWVIRPATSGTELRLEIEFHLGGPAGWLAERLAGRVVDRNMEATLLAARRLLEYEQPAGQERSGSSKR